MMRPDRAVTRLTALGPFAELGLTFSAVVPDTTGGADAYRLNLDDRAKADIAAIAEDTRSELAEATLLAYDPAGLVPPGHAMHVAATHAALLTPIQRVIDTGDLDAYDPRADRERRPAMLAARFSAADGRSVTFYRVAEPLLQFSKKHLGFVFRNGTYHRLVPTDVLLMRAEFDVVVIGDLAFFTSKSRFERAFGFLDELKRSSGETFDRVTTGLRIDGLSELRRVATTMPAMMAKLASIRRSMDEDHEYSQAMTMARLVGYVRSRPELDIAIAGPAGDERLVFDPAPTHRYEIVNLLNDDYLHSEITERRYEATSKVRRRA